MATPKPNSERLKIDMPWGDAAKKLVNTPAGQTPARKVTPRKKTAKKAAPKKPKA